MNKNILAFFLLMAVYTQVHATCYTVVKNMDKRALSSAYKKIAWYAYRHKKKLDYIQKSYAMLERVRNNDATQNAAYANKTKNIVSIPTVEAAKAEADALAEINAINISLIQLLIYQDIKREITENRGYDGLMSIQEKKKKSSDE